MPPYSGVPSARRNRPRPIAQVHEDVSVVVARDRNVSVMVAVEVRGVETWSAAVAATGEEDPRAGLREVASTVAEGHDRGPESHRHEVEPPVFVEVRRTHRARRLRSGCPRRWQAGSLRSVARESLEDGPSRRLRGAGSGRASPSRSLTTAAARPFAATGNAADSASAPAPSPSKTRRCAPLGSNVVSTTSGTASAFRSPTACRSGLRAGVGGPTAKFPKPSPRNTKTGPLRLAATRSVAPSPVSSPPRGSRPNARNCRPGEPEAPTGAGEHDLQPTQSHERDVVPPVGVEATDGNRYGVIDLAERQDLLHPEQVVAGGARRV